MRCTHVGRCACRGENCLSRNPEYNEYFLCVLLVLKLHILLVGKKYTTSTPRRKRSKRKSLECSGEIISTFPCLWIQTIIYNSSLNLQCYISPSPNLYAYYNFLHSWQINSTSSRNGPGERVIIWDYRWFFTLFIFLLYLFMWSQCVFWAHVYLCVNARGNVLWFFSELYSVKDILTLPPHLQLCHISDIYFNMHHIKLLMPFIFSHLHEVNVMCCLEIHPVSFLETTIFWV